MQGLGGRAQVWGYRRGHGGSGSPGAYPVSARGAVHSWGVEGLGLRGLNPEPNMCTSRNRSTPNRPSEYIFSIGSPTRVPCFGVAQSRDNILGIPGSE